MKSLIDRLNIIELEVGNIKKEICNRLNIDSFEWIVEGKNIDYVVEKETIIDGYKYTLVTVDDVDHEYHYALYVEVIK